MHDACNFRLIRDEQLRNNWDIRSRPTLSRQTTHFDFTETVTGLKKSDIDTLTRKIRAKYPQPCTINIRHQITADMVDSWLSYHSLWVEEGIYLSGEITGDEE